MPIRDVLLLRLSALLVAVLLSQVATPGALAQPANELLDEQRTVIGDVATQVEALSKEMESDAADDAALVDIRLELEQASDRLAQATRALQQRLDEINARLEQIGSAPGEGQPPELQAVTEERRRLVESKGEINTLIGEAATLSRRTGGMIEATAKMRRDLFARTLSKRYALGEIVGETIDEFGGVMATLYARVKSWLSFAFSFKLPSLLGATVLAVVAAVVIFVGGRRLFGGLIEIEPVEEQPSYLSRLSVAFWSTFLPTASLAAFLGAAHFLYNSFDVLRSDISRIIGALFAVVLLVFFVYRIAYAILLPDRPNWRVLPIESRSGHVLVWLILLMVTIHGLDYFLGVVNEELGASLALTIGESLVATVLVGVLAILIALVRPFSPEAGHLQRRPWPTWLRYLLYLLGGVTVVAALLGYIGLANFLASQIVVTGAILATMYIGFQSASALSEEGAFAESGLGRRLQARRSLGDTALDRWGLVFSILLYILVILLGVPLILFQWEFQPGDIEAWFLSIATGIHIGSISISLVGILTGIVVFIVGYIVTRWFQRWLDRKVLARGRVEAGVRNSIRTTVGYAGIALALLIGISAAGVDLSNLALIAGALSLGVGFGLQNIVSNFVSGLILLVERPFKAGDWIVAGPVSGTVKKISVRATEIETFQRQTVILPNSELINAAVGNWTHRNNLGRLEIAVGVAYGSDVRKIHAILMDIATNHPLVLKNPEPFVLFAGFGDSSLDFEIRVFLADILTQLDVLNDIRFAVVEAFEREGIEIPFPQRDIHIKSGPIPASEVEERHTAVADEMPETATPGRRPRRKRPDPE